MVWVVCGENSWAVTNRLQKLVQDFQNEHGYLAIEQFEGSETNRETVETALVSQPFFSAKKLVVLKRPSENSELIDSIAELIAYADDTVFLLISETTIDKRTAYYKTVRALPGFQELSKLNGPSLVRWIIDEAKNCNASISFSEAQFLIDRVGQDQSMLINEISKLACYDGRITRKNIELLCEPTPESSIFELLSAIFTRQQRRALELYEQQRMQKVEAHAILNMMVWQLQQIALAWASGAKSPQEMANLSGMSPFAASKNLQLAAGHSGREILQVAQQLSEIDYRSKTTTYDIDEAIKTLVVAL